MAPLVAVVVVAGAVGFVRLHPDGSADSDTVLAASFSCETDAEGACWVPHRLGTTPATATATVDPSSGDAGGSSSEAEGATARSTGASAPAEDRLAAQQVRVSEVADRQAQVFAAPEQLQQNRIMLLFRTWDGRPFRHRHLQGRFTVYRGCPTSLGLWCRPIPGPAPTTPSRPSATAAPGTPARPGSSPTAQPSPTLVPTPTTGPLPTVEVPTYPMTPLPGTTVTPSPTRSMPGASPAPTPSPMGPVAPGPTTAPVPSGPGAPRVIYSDEFNGPSGAAPDSSVWSPTVGDKWGANELECYTSSPNNIQLDGSGHLLLIARQESSCNGRQYSSGRVETRGKESWQYGYFEVRAKMPTGAGMFPAIWMLGPNGVTDWPRSGETDIAEITSGQPGVVHTNVHGIDAEGAHWESGWSGIGRSLTYPGNVGDGFHTYGLDWTATQMRFYFDNQLVRTLNRTDVPVWLWSQKFYLILNAAVGSYGGSPAAGAFPQTMSIDYFRVYSAKPS